MKSPILLCLLFFLATLSAQTVELPNLKLDSLIEAQVAGMAPGVAVGIVQDGKIIYEKYVGYANLADQIKVSATSRFNIASNAKQFTAVCVLNLALEGKLSLKDDFRKYLPQYYPDIKTPILIEHLITHASGIRDFYDLLGLQGTPWWAKTGLDNEDALEMLAAQKELNFLPGSQHAYSNSNYTLLTALVAKVSDRSFDEYSQGIFQQFGMQSTKFSTNYMAVIPHKTLPYNNWGDGQWQQYPMVVDLYGDGFLFTTLRDQLKWEQALQTKNTNKNQQQLLTLSQTNVKGAVIEDYGFGVEINEYKGYSVVQHAGSTGAYGAQFIRFPSENLAIVVMGNNGRIWYQGLTRNIADMVLSIQNSPIPDNQLPKDLGIQEATTEIIGQYQSIEGTIINLSQSNNQLIWKMYNQNPLTLMHEKGNLYAAKENREMKVLFSRKKNQRQFTVYYPGSEPRKHKKIIEEKLIPAYFSSLNGTYYNDETNTEFTLTYQKEKEYTMHVFGEAVTATLITIDYLRMNDFMLKIGRDAFGAVSQIFVDYGRNRDMRFKRKNAIQFISHIPTEDGGQISVNTTAKTYGKGNGDILLTKNNKAGNEEWFKLFGGKSYDKASSILHTSDGGYLIIGSTSSFGNGNYDIWVIKTNAKGQELWNKTYGEFNNEYGFTAEETKNGYLVKGKKQVCPNNTDFENCQEYVWLIKIDKKGKEITNQIQEQLGTD